MRLPMIERAVEVFVTTANQTTPREMMALREELARVLAAPEPEAAPHRRVVRIVRLKRARKVR